MGANIRLGSPDGHEFDAYATRPAAPPLGGVIVLQEIFGVTAVIRGVCERLAEAGHAAIAPALFDRQERGVQLDYSTSAIAQGRRLMAGLDRDAALTDIAACRAQLADLSATAVLGFCLGGTLAWLAAARLPLQGAIGYYPTVLEVLLECEPRCPAMLHMAERDHIIPAEHIDAIRRRHPASTVHAYSAAHGFACEARPEAFDPAAAALAWTRSLDLLARAARHAPAAPRHTVR
jgi:carboxymethylenebutenolidase